jgi:uncharacterized protein YjbI with pentapeptide repeats
MTGAKLSGAILARARLDSAILNAATLRGANLKVPAHPSFPQDVLSRYSPTDARRFSIP